MPEVLAVGAVADLAFGADIGLGIFGGAADAGLMGLGAADIGLGAADVGLGLDMGAVGLDAGLGMEGLDLGLGATDLGLGAADVAGLGGDVLAGAEAAPEAAAAAADVAPLEGMAVAPDVGGGAAADAVDLGGAAPQQVGLGAEFGGGQLGAPQLDISASFGGEAPTGDIGGGSIGEPFFSEGPASAPLDPGDNLVTTGTFGPDSATNPMTPNSFEAQTLNESFDLGPTGESNITELDPTPGGLAEDGTRSFAVPGLNDTFTAQGLGDFANLDTGTTFSDLGFATPDTGGGAGEFPQDLGLGDMTNTNVTGDFGNFGATYTPAGGDTGPSFLGASDVGGGGPTGAESIGDAFGPMTAPGAGGGGGILNSLGLGGLGLTPAQLLAAGGMAGFAAMGPGKISSAGRLEGFNAQQLGAEGRQLLADARAGKITPAQQAQLDEMMSSGEAQLRTQFARMGRDPNNDSSFQYALAQLRSQVEQQRQQFINQMIQQGIQELGLADQSLGQVAQLQTARDNAFTTAIANVLGASTRLFSGVPGAQRTTV